MQSESRQPTIKPIDTTATPIVGANPANPTTSNFPASTSSTSFGSATSHASLNSIEDVSDKEETTLSADDELSDLATALSMDGSAISSKSHQLTSPPTSSSIGSTGSPHTPIGSAFSTQSKSSSGSEPASPTLYTVQSDVPRTRGQNVVRYAALWAVPFLLHIPLSLILTLTTQLLTPLYNSPPLNLHTPALYIYFTIISAGLYYILSTAQSGGSRGFISARVCLALVAFCVDATAVLGRRVGSDFGRMFGPEWGALFSRAALGGLLVQGGTAFALICFDHLAPEFTATATKPGRRFLVILGLSAAYVWHLYMADGVWSYLSASGRSILIQRPEKTMLFMSLLFTGLSLLMKESEPSNTAMANPKEQNPPTALSKACKALSGRGFSLLFLLRIPFLILALRQQTFLRPTAPYIAANGTLRVLHSERSVTGQIVVAENLVDGYRFLRCDHSLLGGRWRRDLPDGEGATRTELGDSIFATFLIQEIGTLALRSDPKETMTRALSLTSDLLFDEEDPGINSLKIAERALIIGLGAGIAATHFTRLGLGVDIVELDPVVYTAAKDYFNLTLSNDSIINLMDGNAYVQQLASLQLANEYNGTKWSYVIQDCYTGGSLPGEMFTREFWEDLSGLVEDDGIVAMNFAGILGSKASRAVLVTLLSVFSQCRAFGDGFESSAGQNDMVNMVVFCTMTHSSLLTFRPPTPHDIQRSRIRSHVYSTFHQNEIRLDTVLLPGDLADPTLMLWRGKSSLDGWQKGTAISAWKGMQKILTPEMWLAW